MSTVKLPAVPAFLKHYRWGVLEVVAFTTGFCLMAYELVASRILAPAIGSSTYVWTSVIGVIIAALSVGYAAGGILADKRVKHSDIALLLLGTTLAMIVTVFFADPLLAVIREVFDDARLRGLTASFLLFVPASFTIGVISPYLVRLRTHSVQKAGRSVASLSVMNALGGISGTFSAGFLFFGYIGSIQTIAILCVLLVGTSWLVVPREDRQLRLAATAVIATLAIAAYLPMLHPKRISIDTPSAHYQVVDFTNKQGEYIRLLTSGERGAQSGIILDKPGELAFTYTKALAHAIAQAPRKERIAVLGGGSYTLPQYLGTRYPQSKIDVVEIDSKLVKIAKDHFLYDPPPNIHHVTADARDFLNTNRQRYDIIVVDVFAETSVPFSLTTTEYTDALHRNVTPGGVVLVNAIASPKPSCTNWLGSVHRTYQQHFKQHRAFALDNWSQPHSQNLLLAYGDTRLDWLKPYATYAEITRRLPHGMVLTDNYAPVERLTFQCR